MALNWTRRNLWDGNYLYYIVRAPLGKSDTLIIQSTDGTWKDVYLDAQKVNFTRDGRKCIFQRRDSIFIITLGGSQVTYLKGVSDVYDIRSFGKNSNILFYRQNS